MSNKNLKGHEDYVVRTILRGLTGEIDGKSYEGVIMVPMGENDDKWIASVSSFIRSSFNNEAAPVATETVARIRTETSAQTTILPVPRFESLSKYLQNFDLRMIGK